MSIEERAADIRANLHQDMHTTLSTEGIMLENLPADVRDELANDAMFYVEKLLAEIEDLQNEVKQVDSVNQRIKALKAAREAVLVRGSSGVMATGSQGVETKDLVLVAEWVLRGLG